MRHVRIALSPKMGAGCSTHFALSSGRPKALYIYMHSYISGKKDVAQLTENPPVDPAQWMPLQFGIFFIANSGLQLIGQRWRYVLSCLWDCAYKKIPCCLLETI